MKAPVPDCLLPYAEAPAWVAWNAEPRSGETRKVPKCPRTGANASVADPRTWGTLAAARRLAEVRAYPGVGIVSAAVPVLAFLDLDRCIDSATGEPTNDDAAHLLDACADTYAERTPSGAGLRIIGTVEAITATVSRKGTTPGGLALEIYRAAPRYLTVTARRYRDHPDALADIGDAVLDLLPLLGKAAAPEGGGDCRADAELVRAIATGEGFHAELCALAARYLGRGISATATIETLRGLMLAHPEAARDDRWQDRYESLPAIVGSAARKFGGEQVQHRRAIARLTHRLAEQRRPAADIRAAIEAEAADQGIPPDRAITIAGTILRDIAEGACRRA